MPLRMVLCSDTSSWMACVAPLSTDTLRSRSEIMLRGGWEGGPVGGCVGAGHGSECQSVQHNAATHRSLSVSSASRMPVLLAPPLLAAPPGSRACTRVRCWEVRLSVRRINKLGRPVDNRACVPLSRPQTRMTVPPPCCHPHRRCRRCQCRHRRGCAHACPPLTRAWGVLRLARYRVVS